MESLNISYDNLINKQNNLEENTESYFILLIIRKRLFLFIFFSLLFTFSKNYLYKNF